MIKHSTARISLKLYPENLDKIQYNELNKDSNGGTELTTRGLFERLNPQLLEGIQIITSRVRHLEQDKKRILHCHDLAEDPESALLGTPEGRDNFTSIVFSSDWQYQQFRDKLGMPYESKNIVIETGFEPLTFRPKSKDKLKLIYTSTPHRGLALLVPVFIELAKDHPELELDVFSGFGIYGPSWEQRDAQFEAVFQACRNHPQINYHGWQNQEVVRAAYEEAHIFAYPCIWPETSCRSLIEAMSAGCLCIHPNLAALPNTSSCLTGIYDGTENHQEHANIFYHALKFAIEQLKSNDMTNYLGFVKQYADVRFGWDQIVPKWEALLQRVKL